MKQLNMRVVMWKATTYDSPIYYSSQLIMCYKTYQLLCFLAFTVNVQWAEAKQVGRRKWC